MKNTNVKRLVQKGFICFFSFLSFICLWQGMFSIPFFGDITPLAIFSGMNTLQGIVNLDSIKGGQFLFALFILFPPYLMFAYLFLTLASFKLEKILRTLYRLIPWIANIMYWIFAVVLQIKAESLLGSLVSNGPIVLALGVSYWGFLICTLIVGVIALCCYSKKNLHSEYGTAENWEKPEWMPSGYEVQQKVQGVKQALLEDVGGRIYSISGEYNGAKFPLKDGEELLFGRDSSTCHIIFRNASVSRRHLSVFFDGKKNKYILLDSSTNGVFYDNGMRLPHNKPVEVNRGSVICFGKSDNKFRLE